MVGDCSRGDPRWLETHAQVLDESEGHPFVRWDVQLDLPQGAYAVGAPGAKAVVVVKVDTLPDGRRAGVWFVGAAAGVVRLLRDGCIRRWADVARCRFACVPAGCADALAASWGTGPGTNWESMSTTATPSPQPGEERVEVLSHNSWSEVTALLDRENPRTHGRPFAEPGQHWVGIRDDSGALVAVGCREPGPAAYPYLTGITVATSTRGRGLGAAVSAVLTRAGLADSGVCTLGMFSDNATARRLYHRLGYTTDIAWATRPMIPRCAARSRTN